MIPGRLFWRIFLSFWLANIVLTASILALLRHNNQDPIAIGKPPPPHLKLLQYSSNSLLTHGIADTRQWLANLPHPRQKMLFVITSTEDELLDRKLPRKIRPLLNQLSLDTPLYRQHHRGRLFIGRYLQLPNQQWAKLVLSVPLPTKHFLGVIRDNLWWIFALAIGISGAICYALARYLTGPVVALREATRQLADGALDTRVDQRLNRRRDELGSLAQDFNTMASQLEHYQQAQQRLIQDISHELRSPLARLQVAQELATTSDPEKRQRALSRITREAERLNEIIDYLLLLPKLETTSTDTLDDTIDLVALIEETVSELQDHSGAPRSEPALEVRFHNHSQRSEWLVATKGPLLKNVIENLLSNAARYCGSPGRITLQLQESGPDSIELRVTDNGPGVPEAELPHIFKAFYRVDAARDRASGGYGLGLAISKRILDLHQASITARNLETAGLEVCIRFTV